VHDPDHERSPVDGDPVDALHQGQPAVDHPDVEDLLYDNGADDVGYEDGLEAQIQARLRASMEDARAQAPNRMAAAAKAVAILLDEQNGTTTATLAPPAPAPKRAAPVLAPPAPPPVVPTAGPAAVLSSVLAASAKPQGPAPGRPLFELRPATPGGHTDPRGENLLVFAERVEHRDRYGRLRQRMPILDVADVAVQRRLTGATVTVQCRTGADLVIKGLRPDEADQIRYAVLLAQTTPGTTSPVPAGTAAAEDWAPVAAISGAATLTPEIEPLRAVRLPFDEAGLLAKLIDLHRAGVIDEHELAEKTMVVAGLAQQARVDGTDPPRASG